MLDKKYFRQLFKIIPLPVAMDLSECALEQALIQHEFQLNSDTEYTLVVGREAIEFILSLTAGGLFHIKLEIQDGLRDEWYLVDEKKKLIVYSPGA